MIMWVFFIVLALVILGVLCIFFKCILNEATFEGKNKVLTTTRIKDEL